MLEQATFAKRYKSGRYRIILQIGWGAFRLLLQDADEGDARRMHCSTSPQTKFHPIQLHLHEGKQSE